MVMYLLQVKELLDLVWLSLRILFQCGAETRSVQLLYDNHGGTEALRVLFNAPSIKIKLISKALLLCLPSMQEKRSEVGIISSEEIDMFKTMLKYNCPSKAVSLLETHRCYMVVLMMKCLLKEPKNAALFLQIDILNCLKYYCVTMKRTEDRNLLASLIQNPMQASTGVDDMDSHIEAEEDQYPYPGTAFNQFHYFVDN